jgi:hypothetical protein
VGIVFTSEPPWSIAAGIRPFWNLAKTYLLFLLACISYILRVCRTYASNISASTAWTKATKKKDHVHMELGI